MSEQTDSGDWVSFFDDFDTHNRQAGARRFWQVLCVLLAKSQIGILVFNSFLLVYLYIVGDGGTYSGYMAFGLSGSRALDTIYEQHSGAGV